MDDSASETPPESPSSEPGRVRVRVRYSETDQMRRAYHAHYAVWCEVGRTDLMRGIGTSYAELEEDGIYLPVSELEISYRSAAEYEDLVRVTTRVERLRSRAVTFAYDLHRLPDERLLAEARTELVCVDGEGSLRRIPGAIAGPLERRLQGRG